MNLSQVRIPNEWIGSDDNASGVDQTDIKW